jgi:uncharacterized oxidoreductase
MDIVQDRLRIPANRLRELTERVLEAAGADSEAAKSLAGSLVLSNLRGVDSHGFMRFGEYLRAIRQGRIVPSARPTVSSDNGPFVLVDGNRCFGQIAARFATFHAIEKVRENGLVLAMVNNVVHVGRLGEYVELAAEHGCIALAWCNGGPRGGNVAPFGGRARALGTNPIAFGIPAGDKPPIIADFSTSISAEGKIRLMAQAKMLMPEPWVIDAEGNPSVNPNDLYSGGAILPMAGHKGFALGLLVEVLGGILAGEGCASLGENPGNGFVILVLNIGRVRPPEEFALRVDKVIEAIKGIPPGPGFSQVLVPGEPELATQEEREIEGIPVSRETWRQFKEAASSVGVEVHDESPEDVVDA